MKVRYTSTFQHGFKTLPKDIQKQAEKQLQFLFTNLHHPSLRAKKAQGTTSIWEARVSKGYRFTFQKENDVFVLRKIGKHNHTLKRP
ncbi:hypothetical protein MYX07_05885 [Patescibacteria group bacterium AH-259-L07]|nr:hypothetical protein [Patescibacteria group bacterium AH-259-L07]